MGETQELGDRVQTTYFPGFVYQGKTEQAGTYDSESHMRITPAPHDNPLAYAVAFGIEHMLPHQQPSAEGAMRYEAVDAWEIEKIKREQERRREQGQTRYLALARPPAAAATALAGRSGKTSQLCGRV